MNEKIPEPEPEIRPIRPMGIRFSPNHKKKLKNAVLSVISTANLLSFIFFASCLDSLSPLPIVMVCINLMWFAVFGYANHWFERL